MSDWLEVVFTEPSMVSGLQYLIYTFLMNPFNTL